MSKSCSNPGQFNSLLPFYVFFFGENEKIGEVAQKEAFNSKIHSLWKRAHPIQRPSMLLDNKVGSLSQTCCSSPPGGAGQGSVQGGRKVGVMGIYIYSASEQEGWRAWFPSMLPYARCD